MSTVQEMEKDWKNSKRWKGIARPYSAKDVERLRGTIHVEHTIARLTSEKLWKFFDSEDYINALGALTGNQAMQMAKAGLKAIYLSGWQVAADANNAGEMYPDQSLYPADSVPAVVRRINNTLRRADQINHSEGKDSTDFLLPIVADAEAGFGGVLNAFELMKGMIEAGAAGVHWEDQLASAKKCGHMGGKVLVPGQEQVQKLVAARLAADIENVPSIIVARTDANGAYLLTSDVDENDKPGIIGIGEFFPIFFIDHIVIAKFTVERIVETSPACVDRVERIACIGGRIGADEYWADKLWRRRREFIIDIRGRHLKVAAFRHNILNPG